jgi:hypothetical protein
MGGRKMSGLQRYLLIGLIFAIQAGVLSAITIGIGKLLTHSNQAQPPGNQKSLYLKIIKCAILAIGQCFGVWLFWEGFGIAMGSNVNDSAWVMRYVYGCLWLTIPLVTVGFIFSWLGGIGLILNAFWSAYLLFNISSNGISFVSEDEIFLVSNGKYDLGLTVLSVTGPLIFLGLFYFIIGWKEKHPGFPPKPI